ncbi:MAG TPA: RidA family protein [Candidatus Acidoferrum sp.]|nr:RidA family protein [Candidatus Acidoferrum sp.]
MGLQRLTPTGLFKPAAYTQVVVATGRRMVFLAGQVSIDADGKLVAPGDFAGQVKQVFANLRTALEGAGATPADVTKITIYVVDYKPELRLLLGEARSAVFGATLPASTLVGVQALAEPGYLIEVEAIAVID